MDAFTYLSVLLSSIIGLGLTQVLAACGRLIRARMHVTWYWPAVLLPEQVDERGVNLRDHYHRQAPWFFGFFAATLVVSFLKEIVLMGRVLEPANLAFHALLSVVALLGMFSRREGMHRLLALGGAVGIGAYIALLFTRLR